MPAQEPEPASSFSPGVFATTHWSVIVAACDRGASSTATEALNKLCESYWYPLYAYIRRKGYDQNDAQDLTQEFFARLLQRQDWLRADSQRGKFRFYLLGALRHFLADAHDHASAQKRGGGFVLVSFDAGTAEQRYKMEPVDEASPETLLERRWALTLLDRALRRLREEHNAAGKANFYERLEPFLGHAETAASYQAVADELGLSESAVKSAIHRLRRRHRELVREEIAHTVTTTNEVEEEIRHLIGVMSK